MIVARRLLKLRLQAALAFLDLSEGDLGLRERLLSLLAFVFAGASALLLALVAWRVPAIRNVRELPRPERSDDWVGAEAAVRPAVATP